MAFLHAFSVIFPPLISSAEVEAKVNDASPNFTIPPGFIESVTGIKTRGACEEDCYNSTLAIKAAKQTLKKSNTKIEDVDLIIFAATGQDFMEPATSHVISDALGAQCPVFDIKNACNSFIVALETADSLISTKRYNKILVTSGETPSKVIKWSLKNQQELKTYFPGFTFGDAGAAALLESADTPNILGHKAWSNSAYWSAGTLPGGGSRHPRGDEYSYFAGNASKMKEAFMAFDPQMIHDFIESCGAKEDDLDLIITHQVSVSFVDAFFEKTKLPRRKMYQTIDTYGNIAAATIPGAITLAAEENRVKVGDLVLCIGLAGGISLQFMLFRFAG